MKTLAFLTLCLLATTAQAQERTATGPLTTEASWAALKNLTEQANNNANSAHIRLNQMETCAKEQKLYSPSTTGADEHGCITPRGLSDYMTGTTVSTPYGANRQVTISKTKNMVVRMACTSRGSGRGAMASLQVYVGSKLMFNGRDQCNGSYEANTSCTASRNYSLNFLEEDGMLYTFDDVRVSAFGPSLLGKREFMAASNWNGVIRSDTSAGSSASGGCTVQIDRTRI